MEDPLSSITLLYFIPSALGHIDRSQCIHITGECYTHTFDVLLVDFIDIVKENFV